MNSFKRKMPFLAIDFIRKVIYFLWMKIHILTGWVFPLYEEKRGNRIIFSKNNIWNYNAGSFILYNQIRMWLPKAKIRSQPGENPDFKQFGWTAGLGCGLHALPKEGNRSRYQRPGSGTKSERQNFVRNWNCNKLAINEAKNGTYIVCSIL